MAQSVNYSLNKFKGKSISVDPMFKNGIKPFRNIKK